MNEVKPPAELARRRRRFAYLSIIPFMLLFLIGAIAFAQNHLFEYRYVPVAFALFFMFVGLALGVWSIRYPCPQCGYNLYLRYDNSMRLVTTVPSVCPNCGLNLERQYVPDSQATPSG